jgi:uncharacterized membrane protein
MHFHLHLDLVSYVGVVLILGFVVVVIIRTRRRVPRTKGITAVIVSGLLLGLVLLVLGYFL